MTTAERAVFCGENESQIGKNHTKSEVATGAAGLVTVLTAIFGALGIEVDAQIVTALATIIVFIAGYWAENGEDDFIVEVDDGE